MQAGLGTKGGRRAPRRTRRRRRKGRDKCRLLFEKPHTLAPARHVAGASAVCVCVRVSTCTRARPREREARSLLFFVEMAEDAPPAVFGGVSRILRAQRRLLYLPVLSPPNPPFLLPSPRRKLKNRATRLLVGGVFSDSPLEPFTPV